MNRRERRAAAKTGTRPGGPVHVNPLFAEALRRHQAGQLKEAHQLCQQILATAPSDIDALHLTGLILAQVGQHQAAVAVLTRAIALNGKIPPLHNTLGDALKGLGRVTDAAACYRRALALAPDFAPAQLNLGNVLYQQGQFTDAVAAYRRVLALTPNSAVAHNNLGIALAALGQHDAAVSSYGRALALNPAYVEAHNNLGNLHRERRDPERAIACYRQALSLRPDYAVAHNNFGIVLIDQGRADDAVAAFARASELAPGYAEAHNNLGKALRLQGRLDAAVASYRRALALNPNDAAAHDALGVALRESGEIEPAVTAHRRAVALNRNGETLSNLGIALREQGALGEAIAALRAALALRPGLPIAVAELSYAQLLACDWSDKADSAARVREAAALQPQQVSPFTMLIHEATPADQLFCARQWVGTATVPPIAGPAPSPRPQRSKIRLGYLSEGFRTDVVGSLIPELIERHDRGEFEVIAYCYGPDDDSQPRQRFRAAFDRFSDIRAASVTDAARLIRDDGIDILIDLMGHTQRARTGILASRPAPVQVSYLGFPGSMGADYIDYAIVDPYVAPMDQQPFYAERLVQLPECYQPSDTHRQVSERAPARAECGLPPEGFVFCCFNNSYKITPAFFDIWMRLLRQAPGSVLWLVATNSLAVENLRREAAARGVAADRLVFADLVPMPQHLARLGLADLFLDTLPYNAGATANDALWMGLPLLTCSGGTYVGRMAGSLLRSIGVPELITGTPAEYQALALRLATEPELLAGVRKRLKQNRTTTPLFDMARYTRHLEAAYRRMRDIWRSGEPPKAFAVPASDGIKAAEIGS